MELDKIDGRPIFAAFEIIVELGLDLKTFYAHHQLQTLGVGSSVAILDEEDGIDN